MKKNSLKPLTATIITFSVFAIFATTSLANITNFKDPEPTPFHIDVKHQIQLPISKHSKSARIDKNSLYIDLLEDSLVYRQPPINLREKTIHSSQKLEDEKISYEIVAEPFVKQFPQLQLGIGGVDFLGFSKVNNLDLNYRLSINSGNNAIFNFFEVGLNQIALSTVDLEKAGEYFSNLKKLEFTGYAKNPKDLKSAFISGVGITSNGDTWFTYGDFNFGSQDPAKGGIAYIKDEQGVNM